jgi:hypothetical protein
VACIRARRWGCTTAIVDRLSFGGNIIETGTDSHCLARTDSATST